MAMPQLDTIRLVETPEGIELSLTVAGPVARALAWIIDSLIRMGLYVGVGIITIIVLPGKFTLGLYLIFMFLTEWFYYVLFEVYRDGQTPGKSALGLQVLHDDGTPVNWSSSMIRNLLRFVDFMPLFYGFALISMLLNIDFKRLGDLVAGTVVIYREEPKDQPILPDVIPVAPRYPLHPQEQQALLSFAERSNQLTRERGEELASLTGPLLTTNETAGNSALPDILGIASWVSGKR